MIIIVCLSTFKDKPPSAKHAGVYVFTYITLRETALTQITQHLATEYAR